MEGTDMRTTQKLIALTLTLILCLTLFAVPACAEADSAIATTDSTNNIIFFIFLNIYY